MTVDWGLAIAIWVLCGIAAAMIAEFRHAGGLVGWFFAGLVLGPIGVLLAVLQAKTPKIAIQQAEPVLAPAIAAPATASGQGSFCPNCGHKRIGSFRYCTNCKFDFDTGVMTDPPAGTPTPAAAVGVGIQSVPVAAITPNDRSPWLLVGIVLLVLVGVGIVAAKNGLGNQAPIAASTDTPTAGDAWFGSSFDPTTFALAGRSDSFAIGSPVAVVGHLSQKIAEGQTITIAVDGYPFSVGKGGAGGADLYAIVIPAGMFSGTPGPSHTVTFTDVGGNVLASGSVTVR